MINRKLAATAMAVSLMAGAFPAQAESVKTAVTVSTAGLDLSTAAGMRKLRHRLFNASIVACNETEGYAYDFVAAEQGAQSCRQEALARVNQQIAALGLSSSRLASVQ